MLNVTKLMTRRRFVDRGLDQVVRGLPTNTRDSGIEPLAKVGKTAQVQQPLCGAFAPVRNAMQAEINALHSFVGLALEDTNNCIVATLVLDAQATVGARAISPDRKMAAVAVVSRGRTKYGSEQPIERAVRIYDLSDGSEKFRQPHREDSRLLLSWSPDSRWVAVGTHETYHELAEISLVDTQSWQSAVLSHDEMDEPLGDNPSLVLSWEEREGQRWLRATDSR